MNTEQKIAWFILGFMIWVLIVSRLLLEFLIVPKFGNGVILPTVIGGMVFYLVGFFTITYLSKRKSGDEVEADERDKILSLQASFGAAMLSYLAVFLFCGYTLWNLRQQGVESVSIQTIKNILYDLMRIVGIAFFGTRSITILILYRQK